MTREEAIEELKAILEMDYKNVPLSKAALEIAIKALEQEPQTFKWCTDCREYDQEKHCCHRYSKVIRDTVEEMKQESKTGHWIDDMSLGYHVSICSNCNWRGHGDTCLIYKPKYCPNCGAKMESEG